MSQAQSADDRHKIRIQIYEKYPLILGWIPDLKTCQKPDEGEPLGDALADAVQPRLIVIADSEFPATRRASPELKERLAQRGIPVVYTRDSGAVKIVVNPTGWKAQTMDGREFQGSPASH